MELAWDLRYEFIDPTVSYTYYTTQLSRVGLEENFKYKPIWTINPMNKVVVFKNKQKEKDHKREMWKNVSNKKVSLVIGCFFHDAQWSP